MTDTTFINDLDRRKAQFEAFITDAHRHALPQYEFDREGNLHPWIRQLRETEAEIWMLLAEQVNRMPSEASAKKGRLHLSRSGGRRNPF